MKTWFKGGGMIQMKICKKILAAFLCLAVFLGSAVTGPVQVKAESELDYVNRCFNSAKQFSSSDTGLNFRAWAYLKGKDDIVKPSWLQGYEVCNLYAVDPNEKIQGKTVDPKWLPQDNHLYLMDIVDRYMPHASSMIRGMIQRAPKGFQGTQREGAKFVVVDYDDEWVTVWDSGFQIWGVQQINSAVILGCSYGMEALLESHPAGFYKIKRDEVWMDFGLKSNHPYQSEAEIPKAGTGVVTKIVNLRPVPNEKEKTYTPVYALPKGTKLNVVSLELAASEAPGSTRKYYKVSFNGGPNVANNAVYYMQYKVPGVYYLDSRYLNVTPAGTKMPEDAVPGKIINVKNGDPVYVHQSKDINSDKIGILTLGTEIWMFPAESDATWITVYFSGQKAYVLSKYIKKGLYKVKDISGLYPIDVIRDEVKLSWKTGQNNVDFSCSITTSGGKVLWSDAHYKENTLIVGRKYIDKYPSVYVKVQATDKNGRKGKVLKRKLLFPPRGARLSKSKIVIGKTKIKNKYRNWRLGASIQYSTNKKFKKAKTIEKRYKNGTKMGCKMISSIKKLKRNKTYYIRTRHIRKFWTKSGYKLLPGRWSKTLKIKTKA